MLRADQIDERFITGNGSRMDRVGRKIIPIAGAQRVRLVTNSQIQCTAEDPMRLIFGVRVWSVLRARRVAPLKDAVAFALEALLQITGIRPVFLTPFVDLNAHA